ncbi:MATE family efflux transporter [Acinetobacter pollinis]|uniref:MATE family efflux transporter n=1 Tax=Acinetobacter pollinis TaxID=2605270 RepID=UPI0018A27CFE|nr:MATE family efflux transporter [Acinetobacter pollinis]MBF7690310.1 MATE family efflux transporter [Acinetobacter pollinis]MBF7692863.1 MATE family efflux transporter [Acinetobacter pollinis]MBF7697834.1 MATE family efflux transporter [Acinetobacter pollinis]MBF7700558.1 MATE family efflux transporter [Acinetobacter pollinis]
MKVLDHISLPILKLALPLILIQLCQASLGLINTLVAGKFNYQDLAAIGLGSSIWTPVFILFTGILYVLVPKTSMLQQNNEHSKIQYLFQQGKNISLLLSIFGFVIVHILAFLCPVIISDHYVAHITQNYLHCVAFAMPGLVYMTLYRFMSEGSSQLKPIMLTFIVLLLSDAILSYLLVNGIGNLPPLGGAGTGLANVFSAYIACFVMRYLVRKAVPAIKRDHHQVVSTSESLQILKQGLPIGVTLVLQILALSTLAFFASELGTRTIAAHQILINIAMVIIMIPVAISSATTIRIATFSAQRNQKGKQLTGLTVAVITLCYGMFMALILILCGGQITALFSQDEQVIVLATGLIHYVAIFLIFDALQTVAAGVLRGLQQFMQPLAVILFCYWIIIIPLSYFMGVKGWLQITANVDIIWQILACGMCLAALAMIIQSYRKVQSSHLVSE